MNHFFLERESNPKNFCCIGQKSISQLGPSKIDECQNFRNHIFLLNRDNDVIFFFF
jgi:hypothetical protein